MSKLVLVSQFVLESAALQTDGSSGEPHEPHCKKQKLESYNHGEDLDDLPRLNASARIIHSLKQSASGRCIGSSGASPATADSTSTETKPIVVVKRDFEANADSKLIFVAPFPDKASFLIVYAHKKYGKKNSTNIGNSFFENAINTHVVPFLDVGVFTSPDRLQTHRKLKAGTRVVSTRGHLAGIVQTVQPYLNHIGRSPSARYKTPQALFDIIRPAGFEVEVQVKSCDIVQEIPLPEKICTISKYPSLMDKGCRIALDYNDVIDIKVPQGFCEVTVNGVDKHIGLTGTTSKNTLAHSNVPLPVGTNVEFHGLVQKTFKMVNCGSFLWTTGGKSGEITKIVYNHQDDSFSYHVKLAKGLYSNVTVGEVTNADLLDRNTAVYKLPCYFTSNDQTGLEMDVSRSIDGLQEKASEHFANYYLSTLPASQQYIQENEAERKKCEEAITCLTGWSLKSQCDKGLSVGFHDNLYHNT